MAEKKPALPTFDFSKRQRSSRLDILEGEQAQQAQNSPTQEAVEEHEDTAAAVAASVITQPVEQREAVLKPANSGNKPAKAKAVAKTAAVSEPEPEPESVKNRGGRPRGEVSKFKKNFYLAQTDLDNLEAAALNIATRARIRVKDDSSVVSLALAFLNDVAENGDQKQFEKLLKIYRQA